jgi:hypothetical protein
MRATIGRSFLLSERCGRSDHQLFRAHPGTARDISRLHPRSNEPPRRYGVAAVLPGVQLGDDRDQRQDSKHIELLALFGLRGGLDPGSTTGPEIRTEATVIDQSTGKATARARIMRELHELIAALDRRVPQVERVGELAIARAGEALRAEAVKRLEELEREAGSDETP